jgi:hypothetical protein
VDEKLGRLVLGDLTSAPDRFALRIERRRSPRCAGTADAPFGPARDDVLAGLGHATDPETTLFDNIALSIMLVKGFRQKR